MRESDRIKEILAALPADKRLFRINSGMGWTGKVTRLKSGDMLITNPRPLHAAPEGWPDLCGWTEVEITPDMVGQRVAIFTAEEVKVTGKLSKAQQAFARVLERMGGYFKVVR
jgi:hypothetical protein